MDYTKAFECVDHNKLWKILKEMGIPDHLTCLLRNLYAGQEATVRTRHGTTTGSELGKEYIKAVYCHPAYLTHMQSTSWEMLGWINLKLESRLPGEILISSYHLRYADDTTLMTESKDELKSFLVKVKEESEKAGLKLNIQKQRSWHLVHQFTANRWWKNGNSDWLYFLGLQNPVDGDCSHDIKRHLLLRRKAMTNLDIILKSRDITCQQRSV